MSITAILIVFGLVLAGSWFFLIRLIAAGRRREAAAGQRLDAAKKKLHEDGLEVVSLLGLLEGIHELGHDNAGATNKEAIARMIVDSACQIMKVSSGSLMLVDKDTNELAVAAAKGVPDQALAARLKSGEGIAGRALESGKTVVVENVETDPRFVRRHGVEVDVKSVVAAPVRVKNRVIGVLSVHSREPFRNFPQRDLKLLDLLASQSAITIENWDLYDNLQKFYLEMVETLARVLEMKENMPRHQEMNDQLRQYAREIGRELNLPDSIVRHIEFAVLIHGIGKIGVDEVILRKPGKLTEAEYEQIKKHPELGKEMLSRVKFLSPITSMILYHQERWDGKGYPAGLKGEEIPLGSRIVAVINAYEAMVSDRPYRKALSQAEAIEEVRRGAGSQFDPKIVDAFVKVLVKGNSSEHQKDRFAEPKRPGTEGPPEPLRQWK